MEEADLKICRQVLAVLTSAKYKDKNFLFLAPFDLSQTPGYLDVVPKLMDLQTLGSNLDAGKYKDRDAFFRDCMLTFENAVAYHGKRKETKWISKFAKDMMKIAQRERKIAEKPGITSKPKSTTGMLLPTKKNKGAGSGTKLKLKIGGGTTSPTPPVATSSTTPAPSKSKVSIKLKAPSQGKTPPANADQKVAVNSDPKKPRLTLKLGSGSGSRGKELPKGVVPPPKPETKKSSKPKIVKAAAGTTKAKTSNSKTSKTKAKLTVKAPSTTVSSSSSKVSSGGLPMTIKRKTQCTKVLNGLKRREHQNIGWFLYPVSDKNIVQDYKAKIPNPMDLTTMMTKLNEKDNYSTLESFVLDLRRIFSNCLRYNTSIKDSLRPVAVKGLETTEKLLAYFIGKPEIPNQSYPQLLFCWKLCINVLDTLYNVTNSSDGNMTAYYFLYPVSFYCGGQFPPDYKQKIKKPMDFGSVTSNLIEGRYSSLSEFETDCKLVLENCITYYSSQPDGKIFTDQANRLLTVLKQQLDALNRYTKSSSGQTAQREAANAAFSTTLSQPSTPSLLGIIEEMKSLKYTDKMTKITEPAMGPFEKPVSMTAFPDYLKFVQTPMDLTTVESKVKSGSYSSPEDFEYDMLLMFQNCIAYNSARKADHLVSIAKYDMKHFKKIFLAKAKMFDDPSAANFTPQTKSGVRKDPPTAANTKSTGSKKAKTLSGPRISLPTSAATVQAKPKAVAPKPSVPKSKPGQPVPLHIAIAQVKEQFPLRRAVKALQSWEAQCAKFFKELMRHPWISAARPKFIFHVPVPVLFPELRDAYATKVKKPIDLTTVECALLAGNKYTSPEDFVNDLALVFSNAIIFNKDGRDVGDPLSCAYFNASIHLLKYCRWLSLELLSDYVENSEHVDKSDDETLPLMSWKLTSGNRKKAREEMEEIVLEEPIERSLEGDRYTWMESECEKLLKSLRHQSDLRHMTFFLQPNYPADYTAFISKPMDWERVQKTLRKRNYEKFSELIDDLRLIFSNALKYNARHAGTDTVSGIAYDSAKYMSTKLEAAINKMMLTVSDRLERERIDHDNSERDRAAAERIEEDRIRAQWKSENPGKEGEPSLPARSAGARRIQTTKRAAAWRREQADFEVPFFDEEDDGQHETAYFDVVRQQKSIFERQRQERKKMQHSMSSLAAGLFMRLSQQELAHAWVEQERAKLGMSPSVKSKGSPSKADNDMNDQNMYSIQVVSKVQKQLEQKDRSLFQFKLSKPKVLRKPKQKMIYKPVAGFEDDSD